MKQFYIISLISLSFDPETGVYYGASESRKDGMSIGY